MAGFELFEYVRITAMTPDDSLIWFSPDGLADPDAICAHIHKGPTFLADSGSIETYVKMTLHDSVIFGMVNNFDSMIDLYKHHNLSAFSVQRIDEEAYNKAVAKMIIIHRNR